MNFSSYFPVRKCKGIKSYYCKWLIFAILSMTAFNSRSLCIPAFIQLFRKDIDGCSFWVVLYASEVVKVVEILRGESNFEKYAEQTIYS
jgi:hypothetical protein